MLFAQTFNVCGTSPTCATFLLLYCLIVQDCVRLQTLLVTSNGSRTLSYAGFGDNRGHMVMTSELFPNTKWRLNRQKFIVATAIVRIARAHSNQWQLMAIVFFFSFSALLLFLHPCNVSCKVTNAMPVHQCCDFKL